MLDEFLKRLAPESAEYKLVQDAFGLSANLKIKLDAIRLDADLSAEGRAKKAKQEALGHPLGHLKQLHSRVTAMQADTANLRKSLAPPPPDRADTYGELERRELRDFVRSLPPAERLRVVMGDPVITEAVLLGHAQLSGLSPEQLSTVKDSYVQRVHGERLAGIERREATVAVVKDALATATGEFRREAGLTEAEIEKALAA